MNAFILTLFALAAASEIACALAPTGGREPVRRIAALVTLCAVISPLLHLWQEREEWIGSVSDAFSVPEPGEEESFREAAETIFSFAERRCGLRREDLAVTFVTGEDGGLTGIRIRAERCPWGAAQELEREASEAFGVPAEVERGGVE